MKRWIKITLAIAAFFIVIAALVPLLVNAETFRPTVESQLSSALGRKFTLGHLSFSLFSGSLAAENITIADDPAFSTQPFLEARSFAIGVEVSPLLFSHQVRITTLTIDAPSIHLIENASGIWNVSSLGGATAKPAATKNDASLPDLTIAALKIKNGSATVSSVPATAKPFVCTGVSLSVQQLSLAKSFPFQLSGSFPGGGAFDLKGTAGPVAQKDASETPFQATLELTHFDPVAAGVVGTDEGIGMLVDIKSKLGSDGTSLTTGGKIVAAKLQLARSGAPATQPINVDYAMTGNLESRAGKISDVAVHAGSAVAHLSGSYRLTPQAVLLDLRLAAPNMAIDQLEQFLPALGVRLPNGSSLKGGTLSANLAVTGPATATTIAGPISVDDTRLKGFDLGSQIQGINPFGGSGAGTGIKTLRADVNASPRGTALTNISADVIQIGTATGSGTISPTGALDFKMIATFTASSGVAGLAGKAANAVGGFMSGLLHGKSKAAPAGNTGIPLSITGTMTSPTIRANVGAMLK